MSSLDPRTESAPPGLSATVPPADSAYWDFCQAVASAQLAAWAAQGHGRVLDLSGDGRWAEQLSAAGLQVLRVGSEQVEGGLSLQADCNTLSWLTDASVDAVLAEGRALSLCLATEQTVRELHRVLRPGGRLLLVVDSLLSGLAGLADQGKWAELADVPSADRLLVPTTTAASAGVSGRRSSPRCDRQRPGGHLGAVTDGAHAGGCRARAGAASSDGDAGPDGAGARG